MWTTLCPTRSFLRASSRRQPVSCRTPRSGCKPSKWRTVTVRSTRNSTISYKEDRHGRGTKILMTISLTHTTHLQPLIYNAFLKQYRYRLHIPFSTIYTFSMFYNVEMSFVSLQFVFICHGWHHSLDTAPPFLFAYLQPPSKIFHTLNISTTAFG